MKISDLFLFFEKSYFIYKTLFNNFLFSQPPKTNKLSSFWHLNIIKLAISNVFFVCTIFHYFWSNFSIELHIWFYEISNPSKTKSEFYKNTQPGFNLAKFIFGNFDHFRFNTSNFSHSVIDYLSVFWPPTTYTYFSKN